jgi:hypothetical protein
MDAKEAGELGDRLADLAAAGEWETAYALLQPRLSERIPFRLLDRVGERMAQAPPAALDPLLGRISAGGAMGGWPVIGAALGRRLKVDLGGAYAHCRTFVIEGDSWYATDILGERVCGPGLVINFAGGVETLAAWRTDENYWVRRAVGVAVHLWTKRAHGDPSKSEQAGELLAFLEPMFSERQREAVKGVGWGLKTIGHYYPDLQAAWLRRQVVEIGRPHSKLMLNKALTYLPAETRRKILRPQE